MEGLEDLALGGLTKVREVEVVDGAFQPRLGGSSSSARWVDSPEVLCCVAVGVEPVHEGRLVASVTPGTEWLSSRADKNPLVQPLCTFFHLRRAESPPKAREQKKDHL